MTVQIRGSQWVVGVIFEALVERLGVEVFVDDLGEFFLLQLPLFTAAVRNEQTKPSSTASCRNCHGVFDATYDDDTRVGRCPGCASGWRAKVYWRLQQRGMDWVAATRLSRTARRRWAWWS